MFHRHAARFHERGRPARGALWRPRPAVDAADRVQAVSGAVKWLVAERLRELNDKLTFLRLCEQLSQEKHTGPITVHFAQGHPSSVDIPCEPTRIRLTKAGTRAQH